MGGLRDMLANSLPRQGEDFVVKSAMQSGLWLLSVLGLFQHGMWVLDTFPAIRRVGGATTCQL